MKIKITFRHKFTGQIESTVIEAENERDARYEIESESCQVISARPLREIGSKPEKAAKPVYVRIQALRNKVERDLCNKQMQIGKYSPEEIAAQRVKEEFEIRKDMLKELDID
jgi:hypothetical protein